MANVERNIESPEIIEKLKRHDEWLGNQEEVISTPVDEERIQDLHSKIGTLTL